MADILRCDMRVEKKTKIVMTKIIIKSGFSVWYSKLKKSYTFDVEIHRYKTCSGKIGVLPSIYGADAYCVRRIYLKTPVAKFFTFFVFCKFFALNASK